MKRKNKVIIIFVEGDTDFQFYQALINYYRHNSKSELISTKIYNLKGIGRFESKVASKIKYEILPKYDSNNIMVFCCYDTDVFELGKKPPTNWKIVRKQLKILGINDFNEIKAVQMIEDWFLHDIKGLCKFLKITEPKNLSGKNGYEKMKKLFRSGNKIYQKGSDSHKFVSHLDISIINKAVINQIKKLENKIFI